MKFIIMMLLLKNMFLPLNVLVDQSNPLPSSYDPGSMPEAEVSLEAMLSDMPFEASITSGYRDYHFQASLVNEDPSNRAPAGHSEHQLGTAFDLSAQGYSYWVNDDNEALWAYLKENAHKYGFVISYPYKECEVWPFSNEYTAACGVEYVSEPWHIRYVGSELALEIYEAGYLNPTSEVLPQDFYVPLE